MSGEKIGSTVGVLGGLVFVTINAGGLIDPWPVLVRLAGVVAAAVVAAMVVRAPAKVADPPSRRAILVYGWSVASMVVMVPVGASILNGPLDVPELTVVWVVAVVGAHFFPFAKSFDAPIFGPLAGTLIAVAAAGAAMTQLIGEVAASATAVVAGFVLIGFAAQGVRRGGHSRLSSSRR